ncbi:MAG: FtsH protease activity modulator HflK [Candidatus Eisenbacteria bacterium]|uniref:Protein HflK n=1 Tax=Eiseniibacteriota bacterium TaxID=2212470 RepID=A0A948S0S8_UNCEI|nr:FtsH protease activity modulator HflK [Candidatus Eisenbacteria bacterium]MBU1950337.1 FtsH protease activity modulator HflK [Candidatus Eisenbacteria bacterium]MBU2693197.1 FtsH protease activity modulator HflK [Candidatus Eisenbacteria bacterium]
MTGHKGLLALLGVFLIALIWIAGGIYTVQNGEAAVLKRFGGLQREGIGPGLHFCIPRPVDETQIAKTGEVHRIRIAGDTGSKLEFITGDENLIDTDIVVQYRISGLREYLFGTKSPDDVLQQAVRTALLETASKMKVDDILTSGKTLIQNEVRIKTQDWLKKYGTGITVVAVTLQSVDPPVEAAAAFRRVSDARAESAQSINNAESQRERKLSLARAESAQMIAAAEVEAENRFSAAVGAAQWFGPLLQQNRDAPLQTRVELYRKVMEDVLSKAEMIILAPGESPRIDVHLRRGEKE